MADGSENHARESHATRTSEFERAYIDALLDSDARAAENAIREAIDAKLSGAEIADAIIAPALGLISGLWQRGEISIADEYTAIEISTRVLVLQREAQRVARARHHHRVMLATPAGELHDVALRIAGDLLRDAGYKLLMLGVDVPTNALARSARRHRPAVIWISSTLPGGLEFVLGSIETVQQQCPEVGFVLGGHGLAGQLHTRPNVRVCQRVSDAVDTVDAIVKRANLN